MGSGGEIREQGGLHRFGHRNPRPRLVGDHAALECRADTDCQQDFPALAPVSAPHRAPNPPNTLRYYIINTSIYSQRVPSSLRTSNTCILCPQPRLLQRLRLLVIKLNTTMYFIY